MSGGPTGRLFLVRHTESQGHARRAFRQDAGDADALTPQGERQAALLGEWLRGQQGEGHLLGPRVYASTAGRAGQTARAITGALNTHVTVLPDLHEMNVGIWACRTYADLDSAVQENAPEVQHPDGTFGFPGGESAAGSAARFRAVLNGLNTVGGTPIVVSHGFVLRAFLADLRGADPLTVWQTGQFMHPNAGVTELHADGNGWHVARCCTAEHLTLG